MNLDNNIAEKETMVIAICKAWNNLDISFIENFLTDDFEYSSQMVVANMNGKDTYINYLKGKFIAIKEGNDPVKAEMGYFDNSPCVIIIQQLAIAEKALYKKTIKKDDGTIDTLSVMTNVREAIILLEFNVDKIKKASMCMIAPNINDVKRTGIFPV
jgi:hypothetical protein